MIDATGTSVPGTTTIEFTPQVSGLPAPAGLDRRLDRHADMIAEQGQTLDDLGRWRAGVTATLADQSRELAQGRNHYLELQGTCEALRQQLRGLAEEMRFRPATPQQVRPEVRVDKPFVQAQALAERIEQMAQGRRIVAGDLLTVEEFDALHRAMGASYGENPDRDALVLAALAKIDRALPPPDLGAYKGVR